MASASNIGKWSAQASIDASGVQKGAAQVIQQAKGMESALEGVFGRMGAAVKFPGISIGFENVMSAVGLQAGRMFTDNFQKTVDENLELGFLNDRLGTSIEWLSTLQTAASEVSITGEQFSAGMNRLNMRIGEAALGSAEARKSFTDLGLSFERIESQSFEQNFTDIAQALSQVASRSERARLAQELFGRSEGQRMLRLMEDGATGLAIAMGDVRSRGGFITADGLERIRAADDAMDRITTRLASTWRNFVVATAPAVVGALDGINNAMDRIADAWARITTGGPRPLIRPEEFGESLDATIASILQGVTPTATPAFDVGAMDAEALRRLEERFGANWQEQLGGFVLPHNVFEGANSVTELANAATALSSSMLTVASAQNVTATQATANTTAFQQQTSALRVQIATMGMSAEAAQRFRNQIAGLTEAQLQEIDVLNSAAAARRAALAQQESAMNLTRQLATQARSPLEVMENRLRQIDNAGLNAEQRGRLFAAAMPTQSSPLLGSMSAGSSEVASIIQSSMVPQRDIAADTLAVLQGMREDQERDREEMREIGRTITAFLTS